jgi:hypothetical protein
MPDTKGDGRAVVLYARVSTEEQARTGYSLAQQVEALREYAVREGYEILEEVIDPGQSGGSLERPGMERVRDLVAASSVSVVLAQEGTVSLENPPTTTSSSGSSRNRAPSCGLSTTGVTRARKASLRTASSTSLPSTSALR